MARDFGPRILSIRRLGGENLLAAVPQKQIDTAYGPFYLRGGHRLWHAPEAMPRSYVPDNTPPEIKRTEEHSLHCIGSVEGPTQIQKDIQITLREDSVRLEHSLTNHGNWPVELAPWAITMLKPGGIAVFPETSRRTDPHGLLPNRALVLWSYTRLSDPRLIFDEGVIRVDADAAIAEPLKFGYANTAGWQAYFRPDLRTWFIKACDYQYSATYPDMGSSAECYCCGAFIELESLGPLVHLEPGKRITHTEVWYVWGDMGFDDLGRLV
ncbi:MAG: hypothetical protein HC915_16565 [Anaerolineae bacterium]|nr:hypothetical protein [Anaerolineae bacterium]